MSDALGSGSPVKIGLAIAAQLAACASFSPDGGMATVQETAAVELGKDVVKDTSPFEAAFVGDRVRVLLGRSLTADAAVQIALLNNQGLQASYNELGISEAQYVLGNLSMTNHPIHLHGVEFIVSCTDGGWVPEQAAWPEVTVDIGVGQIRAIDFVASAPGDWIFHCHKSHHSHHEFDGPRRTKLHRC